MLYVYIAGPYTQGNPEQNVANALAAAEELCAGKMTPYIPHLTHYWHINTPHTYQFWMELDQGWLKKCDALVRLQGISPGADEEVAYAIEHHIPVFQSVEECIKELTKKPPLTRVHDEEDYALEQGVDGIWVEVDNIDVHIIRTDEGVIADLWSNEREDDEPMTSTYAHFNEAEKDEDGGLLP